MPSVIETERKLIQVERQVLFRDMMKRPSNPAFEQRPNGFDAVDVDIPAHVGLGVIDGLMFKLGPIEPVVRQELVGVDFRAPLGVEANKPRQ